MPKAIPPTISIANSAVVEPQHRIELLEVEARQHWANRDAAAEVVLDNRVIFAQIPVKHLWFIEKQRVFDLFHFPYRSNLNDAAIRKPLANLA